MALDGDACGASVAAVLQAIRSTIDPSTQISEAQLEIIWKAVCNEIFDHIKANGVVPGTGLIAPGGGGPVSGATTIT